jgi:septal ring factor EnvC (AmiA/AmiB activator)
MTCAPAKLFIGLFLLLSFSAVWPQRRHDPLTAAEIDQLRDTAQEPDLRLKLYVQFARNRLTSVEQVRSDPKVTDQGGEIHARLQDFAEVYDELNDNLDTYADRRADLRKVLKTIIEADSEFQARLRALKDSADASKEDAQKYEFLLSEAIATVDSSIQDHRQLLAEQEEAAKHKKKGQT